MSEDLPYRPCVGIMLINRDGLVFVGRRGDIVTHAWQMPQGGIDKGESPRKAALRELHEEVGTDKVEIAAELDNWLDYDLPPELLRRAWKGRYRGQTQRWFAMRFLGSDSDIDLNAHEPHKPEFVDWRWERMHRLPELTVDFKRDVYHQVVDAFSHLAIPGADT